MDSENLKISPHKPATSGSLIGWIQFSQSDWQPSNIKINIEPEHRNYNIAIYHDDNCNSINFVRHPSKFDVSNESRLNSAHSEFNTANSMRPIYRSPFNAANSTRNLFTPIDSVIGCLPTVIIIRDNVR